MSDYTPVFDSQYHTYPVFSQEMSYEGSLKRFRPMPQITEVFEYAMLGLPRILPMTNQQLTPDIIAPYLESAIVDIECALGCNISEVTHFYSSDYIDGMFSNNFCGIMLSRWPATEVTKFTIKYPHTNTSQLYQTYTIPPAWIYLKRNKMNIVASFGSINAKAGDGQAATAGGIFSFITGFSRGAYQPGMIEVIYKAGFSHDKLPASLSDLIKTWSAINFLSDISPVLFPNQSVNVSVDGISQGVSYNVPQLIQGRLQQMEKKKLELSRNFKKGFGKSIATSFVGA